MEKKMYKYTTSQTENLKNNKKQKEIKFLTNYIPIKKTHAQSNISEYETEQSIQKNFSNKCQKNKPNTQARSVQTTHNNQFSPKKIFNVNKSNRNFTNASRSSKGSFYNLNNLNIYDYFSEKVILTQKKCIDYKTNKINTLQKQITLLKQEINMYEKKANNSKNRMTQNTSKNNIINSSQFVPKILYVNKTNNKYLLVNNNSYMSLNTFGNNDLNNEGENADKKLEKHLSNLLTENNSDNNLKCKNNINVKNASANNDTNKKKLLSIIYQSKKGCYNHNNNNYDHNIKNILKTNNLNTKKEICSKKNLDKEIKHNLYFYTNKIKEKQIEIKDNKNIKRSNYVKNFKLENEYKTLEEKIDKLFNNFFQLYDKKSQKQ
jgi:hypothetical protein